MSERIAKKIGKTKDSFPSKPSGRTIERCPRPSSDVEPEPDLPTDAATIYEITQEYARTMAMITRQQRAQREKKSWIEIILVDGEGNPVPDVRYKITPPGGAAPKEGRLNKHGQAGYYQIESGECKVTFPDLDKEAWN